MAPAASVIIFTVFSGLGYGYLIWLGIMTQFIQIDSQRIPLLFGLILALTLITIGLLASTFHLRHPERAWRAFSQWRSSWLSREAVLAVLCYLPAIGFAAALFFESYAQIKFLGLMMSVIAFLVVYSTSMIYHSLKTIRQWQQMWVPSIYLSYAVSSGGLGLSLTLFFIKDSFSVNMLVIAGFNIALAAWLKWKYWQAIDNPNFQSTIGSATGLHQIGDKINQFEAPHSSPNWVMKEMIFKIGRKHALQLRRLVLFFTFFVPFIGMLIGLFLPAGLASIFTNMGLFLIFISFMIGVGLERWLFFAEATHVVSLFYGAHKA